jgi:hypothetical protein
MLRVCVGAILSLVSSLALQVLQVLQVPYQGMRSDSP